VCSIKVLNNGRIDLFLFFPFHFHSSLRFPSPSSASVIFSNRYKKMFWKSLLSGASLLATLADCQTSPPYYPSPWGSGGSGWAEAYEKAAAFVSQLTLPEKVNLTTGVGWEEEQCVGNTGSIPRLGFRGFCNQDSPLGIRDSALRCRALHNTALTRM
jgi:hypothetical protein